MLEAGWTVPPAGEPTLSFYPQVWVRLSRLGHVAASVGAELPAVGPEPRHPRLIAFVLWDYGDAPLMHGWEGSARGGGRAPRGSRRGSRGRPPPPPPTPRRRARRGAPAP